MKKSLILCFFIALISTSLRAEQFWDPDGAVVGSSVSGNWDTLTANWSSAFDAGGNVAWVQNENANFDVAADYAATVVEPITVGNITVTGTAGALTIDRTLANGLTLAADAIFNIGGSRTVNLSATIGGAFILTKSGNGTLTLSGANTYSSGTTMSGGTIGIGVDSVSSGGVITSGALGTGTLTFSTAATMLASGTARVMHNPVILNAGLTNSGTLGLTFTNASFKINGATRNVVVNNTADLVIGSDLMDDGVARTMQKIGAGRLILAGNNSGYLGQITVVAGTLAPGTPTSLYTVGTISVSAAGTLNLNGFNANVWRLGGAGSVVLGANTLTAGNDVNSSEFTGVMSGTGGYVKVGGISQVLSGTNTFSGGITITAGSLYLPTNAVTGSPFALGAGTNTITITGAGRIGQNRGGTSISIVTNKVVLNSLTAGLDCASGGQFVLSGQVSGAGGFVRTTQGSGFTILAGDNTFTGGVEIDARPLGLGHKRGLGTGPLTIGHPTIPPGNTIELGCTLDLVGADAVTNVTTINQNFTFNGTLTGFGLELSGPVTLSSGTKTNTVTGTGLFKFSGVIGGSGGLNKAGANTLVLSGNNTYASSTIVSEGILALTNSGSLASSSDITVFSGATLDASGRTDSTLTVGAAQTLKGEGAFNVIGHLTNNGVIEMKANKSGSVSSDSVQGLYRITYGGTLNLVLSGDPLTASDSMKLFDATNYVGSFATILPVTPGSGLAWDTSTLTTDGTLRIVPVPSFTVTTLSGTNLVMSGTNGLAGGPYSVLSSTNIATPRTNWSVVQVGTFELNGDFSVTNGIAPGEPQRFFMLRIP